VGHASIPQDQIASGVALAEKGELVVPRLTLLGSLHLAKGAAFASLVRAPESGSRISHFSSRGQQATNAK
jgi:hypothetical protein